MTHSEDRFLKLTGRTPKQFATRSYGLSRFLYARGIRIFDYARVGEPLRERTRSCAQEACADAGMQIEHIQIEHIQIEHISKSYIRKEDLYAYVLARQK